MAQPYYLFVDTNILLDFYRVRNESGLKLLSSLANVSDRVITTYQVEMEFKKNRHKALQESYGTLKPPGKVPHAAFLAETKAAAKLDDVIDDAAKRVKRVKSRLEKVLANPTAQDPVYQSVQRIFVADSDLNLKRTNPKRKAIKRLALRRFLLGYPPRKKNDTSMGDAFNWEWIIQVALEQNCHVIIVSRDADFGIELNGKAYINDWLIQEFRDRVAKPRKLILHTRLSSALKAVKVPVAKAAESAEEDIAASQEPAHIYWPEIGVKAWESQYMRFIEELRRRYDDA